MAECGQKNLSDCHKETELTGKQLLHNRDSIEAVYVGCFYTSYSEDEDVCKISGIALLHDGLILIADRHNDKLNLYGSHFDLLSQLELTDTPIAMLALDGSDVLVSLDDSCLQRISVLPDDTLSPGPTIKLKMMFIQMTRLDDNILALVLEISSKKACCFTRSETQDFKLVITDTNGKIITNILSETRTEGGILSETRRMTINQDQKTIYLVTGDIPHVSGGDKCVALSLGGQIIFTYQDRTCSPFKGVCCDSEGHVFLTCQRNKVITLNTNGEAVQDIIDVPVQTPIENIPNEFFAFVAFDHLNKRLYIEWEHWGVDTKVLIYDLRRSS